MEDDETRLKRLEDEKLERDELNGVLDKEQADWRIKKTREQQLQDTKRRRQSEGDDDVRSWGARRKAKKLKFATIEENWGEESSEGGDQSVEQPMVDCDLGSSLREQRILTKRCKPSLITDYYTTGAKDMEQIVWEEDGE